jgi:hypothetical protein
MPSSTRSASTPGGNTTTAAATAENTGHTERAEPRGRQAVASGAANVPSLSLLAYCPGAASPSSGTRASGVPGKGGAAVVSSPDSLPSWPSDPYVAAAA